MKGHSRIYLAGKVTGLNKKTVKVKFNKAKKYLLHIGFDEVVNPMDHVPPTASWTDAMLILLPILSTCNYIALLPDYTNSTGAITEYNFAVGMEKEGKIKAIIHLTNPITK